MNCALLKEDVIEFILENKMEVLLQRVSFKDVPGDVCKDLLAAAAMRDNDDYNYGKKEDDEDYDTMRVCKLRQKLHEKGLDVDGSRDALIAALREQS